MELIARIRLFIFMFAIPMICLAGAGFGPAVGFGRGNEKILRRSVSFSHQELPLDNLERDMEDMEISGENLREVLSEVRKSIFKESLGGIATLVFVNGEVSFRKEYVHPGVNLELKRVRLGKKIEIKVSSESKEGKTFVLNLENEFIPKNGDIKVFL